ncbi:MAG: alpha-1,2-fucosyltransferase [Bacteroidales bacterium]|jgi:hypothetical protein
MLRIIKMQGGLGNQMFEYAFYLALKKKSPFYFYSLDLLDSWFAHNGYEIFKTFTNLKYKSYKFFRRQRKFYNQFFTKNLFSYIIEDKKYYGKYNKIYFNNCHPFTIYDGYWQSELYFNNVKEKIREVFRFNTNRLNIKSSEALNKILTSNSVSIHIRRGDYLDHSEHFGNICTLDYYHASVKYIQNREMNLVYFIISDDPDWARENFKIENSVYVDWNKADDSWQDMCLMTYCNHNIIANSSFSWWGAWLNKNPNKIVIAPKKWSNYWELIDTVPSIWIRL